MQFSKLYNTKTFFNDREILSQSRSQRIFSLFFLKLLWGQVVYTRYYEFIFGHAGGNGCHFSESYFLWKAEAHLGS